MKGKFVHVILFLPQRRQQKKNMEKYHAKMAKAGNGEGLAPAVIDCWYYLSRATCWDSAEGWPGWPWECIWANAGMVNLPKNTNLILPLKQSQRSGRGPVERNSLNLFSQLFGQAKANANQAKANAEQTVSSQHQGRTWLSICTLYEQTAFTLWNWWLLPSTPLGLKRLIVPISHLDNRSCFKKHLFKLSTL